MASKKARTAAKKPTKKSVQTTKKRSTKTTRKKPVVWQKLTLRERIAALRNRRPHQSFRLTYRRDYIRSLEIPGYFSFTHSVWRHLFVYKKIFIVAVVVFALLNALLVGLASQDMYMQAVDILKQTGSEIFSGGWGEMGKGLLLTATIVSGSFDGTSGDAQQIYGLLLFLMLWLCTIWLVRAQLAGHAPKFRDGLYNSAAPLVATLLVSLLFIVQLVPAALGILLYQVASISLQGGMALIVFIIMSLLIVLSLYLATSTFIAMVVITLPGMYPWRALRIAGDLVVGRRVRILLRLLWGCMAAALTWTIIVVPIVVVSSWLQQAVPATAMIPIVPGTLAVVTSITTVFLSTYVYLLYRKVVDDDASPA